MTIKVLNPSYDEEREPFRAAPRTGTLRGAVIGVVSNGKQGTGRFFDAFAERMTSHHGVARVERLVKPNYSAPAGVEIMDATKDWQALVSGIGD